jgi:hypothetical protein
MRRVSRQTGRVSRRTVRVYRETVRVYRGTVRVYRETVRVYRGTVRVSHGTKNARFPPSFSILHSPFSIRPTVWREKRTIFDDGAVDLPAYLFDVISLQKNNCVSIKPFYYINEKGHSNYQDIVKNIYRCFNDKVLMRDKVVNESCCSELYGVTQKIG